MDFDISSHKRILVVGASGDLGIKLIDMLAGYDLTIGAHCFKNKTRLKKFADQHPGAKMKIFSSDTSQKANCTKLIKEFVQWAGGIDYLVQLSGAINKPVGWEHLNQEQWDQDLAVNLTGPFFLAQQAFPHMKHRGGKIILTSTASASHGGGKTSMAYGAAKAAVECVTKGLAREGAKHQILVNGIAPGFIHSQFHTKQMKRTSQELKSRALLVPLQRAGDPADVAQMILFLLSSAGNYITGQIMAISGGDWL